MIAVVKAYRWFETGQVGLYLGHDPPADLLELIGIYHSARQATLAKDLRDKRDG